MGLAVPQGQSDAGELKGVVMASRSAVDLLADMRDLIATDPVLEHNPLRDLLPETRRGSRRSRRASAGTDPAVLFGERGFSSGAPKVG